MTCTLVNPEPSLLIGPQETNTDLSWGSDTFTQAGEPGAVLGVIGADAGLGCDSPALLWACTVKVTARPFSSPFSWQGVERQSKVRPVPGPLAMRTW